MNDAVELHKAIPGSSLWIVPRGRHVPMFTGRFPLTLAANMPFVATVLDFSASADNSTSNPD